MYSKQLQKPMKVTPNKIISIIAHDLKDPLISISGIADILVKNWNDFSNEEKTEILNEIKETSDTTLLLLADLLDWSKKIAEISEPVKKVFDATQQIKVMLEPLNSQVRMKNIAIENQVLTEILLYGDTNMFSSVIRNLMTNAVKSCPNGGNIFISADQSGTFYRFCIADNGFGMTKSQIEALFAKTTSASNASNCINSSSGFGLVLCRDFVEMNGGDLWAESEEGKGTRVFFTVPSASPGISR
jgi:two-component system, sensor histidine kinase and response regulator